MCSVLFANLNRYRWIEPEADDPDDPETAEIVEAASTRSIPLAALAPWVEFRLLPIAPPLLDAENEEAERYPLGLKEFWRSRLVGKATYGIGGHPMTDAEFELDWAAGESP